MPLVLQDNNGLVVGANAYVTEAEFRAYHQDRGVVTTQWTQAQVEAAIIKATAYLDVRFNYVGRRKQKAQTTQWPRLDAEDADQNLISDIPQVVKWAVFEYALRALATDLMPDPVRDGSGYSVTQKTERVGEISEYTQYAGAGYYNYPDYPLADGFLFAAGLIRRGRRTARA